MLARVYPMKPPGSAYDFAYTVTMNAVSLITLRPAMLKERELIYHWLTASDLTPDLMGPPHFPEVPVPSYKDFCQEFGPELFMGADKAAGRVFMIELLGKPIGQTSYHVFAEGAAVLDICLAGSEFTGWGYGSCALQLLIQQLRETGITQCLVQPSARNLRAQRTYTKAGFVEVEASTYPDLPPSRYQDAVLMIYRR